MPLGFIGGSKFQSSWLPGKRFTAVPFLQSLFFLIAVYLMAYAVNSTELHSSGTRSPNQTYVKKDSKSIIFLIAVAKLPVGSNLMEGGAYLAHGSKGQLITSGKPILTVSAGP